MKIAVAGKGLADQCGADHLAVSFDQAAIRLMREDALGDAGHRQRVDEAGEDGEGDDQGDRGTKLAKHGCLLRQDARR